jgi:hypothetical protein
MDGIPTASPSSYAQPRYFTPDLSGEVDLSQRMGSGRRNAAISRLNCRTQCPHKRREQLRRDRPHQYVGARLSTCAETLLVRGPDLAAGSVRDHDQVIVSIGCDVTFEFSFELEPSAELAGSVLQEQQQLVGRNTDKAMVARVFNMPTDRHSDIFPIREPQA